MPEIDWTESSVPEHIRAAIHAGRMGRVTIFCDVCGAEHTADYTGATQAVRFAAARRHLAENLGWKITADADLCPDLCSAPEMQAFLNAPVQFWMCPHDHPKRHNDNGFPLPTVEWRGGVAFCLEPGCANTSAKETRQ